MESNVEINKNISNEDNDDINTSSFNSNKNINNII